MNILWGGLQVTLLCAAATGYGALVLPSPLAGNTAAERLITRFALGLGLVIMATTAAGWLRLWGPWFHLGVLGGGIVLLGLKHSRPALPILPFWRKRHLIWAGPALTVLLFYAAFPPTFYDALLYHLGLPTYYLRAGGFVPWIENVFSALPQNGEMLNLLLLSGGSVHGPKLLSLALALALLLYLVDWGRAGGLRHPWLPALMFFSIPEVAFLAVTEKNDILLMLFLLLAVRRLASPEAAAGNWREYAMAGVFLGLAGGVKWQGLLYGAAFTAWRILASRAPLGRRIGQAALIGIIVIILISPWLARNQAAFGNPVHPYLSGLFSGGGAAREQARQIHEGVRRGQGFAPGAILSFCLRMFLKPYSLGLTHITGVLPLLLLPLLFFKGGLPGRSFLLGGCALAFVLLLAVSRVPRYFLPVFMVLSLPLAAGWEGFLQKLPRFRRLAFTILSVLVLVQAVQAVSLMEHLTLGGRYAQGKCRGGLPVGARYLDIIPYYPAVTYINRTLSPQARIAFIGEERTFYLERAFLCASSFDANPVLGDLLESADAVVWAGKLRNRGITHVLYCPAGLERMGANGGSRGMAADQGRRLAEILGEWPKFFDDGRYSLYTVPRS